MGNGINSLHLPGHMGGVEVQGHSFLTKALDVDEGSNKL